MKISELKPGQGNVDVEGVIKEVGEIRSFNKFGRQLNVSNAILEDDSGRIKLTLWNDDATRFKEGDSVKIVNGYVNEFQGEKQLTSGKFGSMEKKEKGAGESNGSSGTETKTKSDKKMKEFESSEKSDDSEESSEIEEEEF